MRLTAGIRIALLLAAGCGAKSGLDGGVLGDDGGGSAARGGALGSGGTVAVAGSKAAGGMVASGGTMAAGGMVASAGTPGAGGAGGGISESVSSVVVGDLHTCVVTSGGAVRCWGRNEYGVAGYAQGLCPVIPTPCSEACCLGNDETPAAAGQVVDVGGNVVQLSAGAMHTCAVLDTGAVRCWGRSDGLGYGSQEDIGDDETPASAGDVDVGGAVVEVAVGGDGGGEHTCALLVGGRVRCWGYGNTGCLGYANTQSIGDDESPATAGDVELGGRATQIVAGDAYSCALLEEGTVRCWGFGRRGRLGYGNTQNIGDDETPAAAGDVDVGGPVVQIAAGGRNTCALLRGGRVRCWGFGADGALGYATVEDLGDDETPAAAGDVPLAGSAVQVSVGRTHACALLDTGQLRCWGSNAHGELGLPSLASGCFGCTGQPDCCIGDDETPATTSTIDVGGGVARVAVGVFHVCALLDTGAVRCWGSGQDGMLGYGNALTIGDDEPPAAAGDVAVF